MKKLLLASAAAFVVAGSSALAADLPVYAEPVAPAPVVVAAPLWTGFYVGGQLGYAFGDNDSECSFDYEGNEYSCDEVADEDFGDFGDNDSLFVGAHIGYDVQIGSFVLGALADVNWLIGHDDDDADGEFDLDLWNYTYDFGNYSEIMADYNGPDWYGTARLRAGFAFGRALVYGTGGLAFAHGGSIDATASGDFDEVNNLSEIDDPDAQCDFNGSEYRCDLGDDGDDMQWGWALGAGVEFLATNNFSVGLEYLYVNLGENDQEIEFDTGESLTIEQENDFHTISVKGSYRFNFGG